MAPKRRGSNNRTKAKVHVAKVSVTMADQRRDFHHKAARDPVTTYDRIGVEDLKIKNLSARGSRAVKVRAQPLDCRCGVGSVPRHAVLAGEEGREGSGGALRRGYHTDV